MITKNGEHRPEIIMGHKGGAGPCELTHILEPDQLGGAGRCFCICTLPVGSSIGKHQHLGDFETYHILTGKARYMDGDEDHWLELNPGDTSLCPDGGWHAIENIGSEPLVYVAAILYTSEPPQ